MNNVPKCKKCEFFKRQQALAGGGIDKRRIYTGLVEANVCTHNPESCPLLRAKDIKTSPKWCPLREENCHANKI